MEASSETSRGCALGCWWISPAGCRSARALLLATLLAAPLPVAAAPDPVTLRDAPLQRGCAGRGRLLRGAGVRNRSSGRRLRPEARPRAAGCPPGRAVAVAATAWAAPPRPVSRGAAADYGGDRSNRSHERLRPYPGVVSASDGALARFGTLDTPQTEACAGSFGAASLRCSRLPRSDGSSCGPEPSGLGGRDHGPLRSCRDGVTGR